MAENYSLINDSYGLGAAVISNDTERCDRISEVSTGFLNHSDLFLMPSK